MSVYKSMMLGEDKKKVNKQKLNPKKNMILENVKKEINESELSLGIQTMKDKPPFQTPQQLKEVGASAEYRKYSKKIDKTRDLFGREVLKFYELLRKKQLKNNQNLNLKKIK